ncbi:MAG: antibiotic biosynthesis monooxygenase family protein [Aestuariivirgaceae bacterium]
MSGFDFAATPKPPYYAVIFSSQRTGNDPEGYAKMAAKMDELAKTMPGYLGIESIRSAENATITVSYWQDEEAIRNWRTNAEHRIAQEFGKSDWYQHYELRIAKVERAYDGPPTSS